MKICFLVENIFLVGGVSRVVTTLANQMAEKHLITVSCISENVKWDRTLYNLSDKVKVCFPEEIADIKKQYFLRRCMRVFNKKIVKIKLVRMLEWIYLPKRLIKKYVQYFNDNSFDVIVAAQGRTSLLLAKAAPRISATCIGWQHNSFDAYFNCPYEYYWNQFDLFKKYIPQLQNYIVLTDDDERRFYEQGFENVQRIYNPVQVSENRCNTSTMFHKEYDLVFVGRLVKKQKGLDYLVEIINQVKLRNNQIRVAVVGDGEDKEFLQSEITRLQLEKNILVVGDSKNVSDYYSNSKVLISTSRWEGFGLVLVEGMSFGLPVVSFDTTGPKEIIGDSGAGILIPKYDVKYFANQIIELLNDPDKVSFMGISAKKRASDFEPEEIEDKWYEVFTSASENG